jgi:uncharacterized membrane protein YesL
VTKSTDTRSERYYRYSQRAMVVGLLYALAVGVICLVAVLRPDSAGGHWISLSIPLLVVALLVALFILQRVTLRGESWRPSTPEAQTVLRDEWRQANIHRAMRGALAGVVIAQMPAAVLLMHVPSERAVVGMAGITISVAVATLQGCYLYYSREGSDG